MAKQQIESGRVEDLPHATAREVSAQISASQPDHARDLGEAAALFDETLYGGHPAGRDDAIRVMSLDESLGARR